VHLAFAKALKRREGTIYVWHPLFKHFWFLFSINLEKK
jgi:hypothetical protein